MNCAMTSQLLDKNRMTQHDNSYKNIFSHPRMVRDLLSGFVNEPWLTGLLTCRRLRQLTKKES
jgi:hypothetical protein